MTTTNHLVPVETRRCPDRLPKICMFFSFLFFPLVKIMRAQTGGEGRLKKLFYCGEVGVTGD